LTTPDESVLVKGSPVASFQKFIENELSPAQRDTVFSRLPADMAARMRKPIGANETVPVWVLNRVTEEAAKVIGENVDVFARRVGRQGATDAFKGMYRFFAVVLTPAALLSKTSQMWNTLYNRGDLIVENQTDNGATIRLVDYPTERVNCERLTGWIERVAEIMAVQDVHIEQTTCFALGARECRWELRWK
jgi:hypothetical protein